MDYRTLTEEQVRNATTYVPIAEKMEFVNHVGANRCIQMLAVSYKDQPMPPVWREDPELKSRYLLTALLKMYFHIDVETLEDDEWLMPRDEYDRWCGGHIINTIERYKANKDLRDIIFNLMYDYKDLEKRVNLELYGRLNAMNDVIVRAMQIIGDEIAPTAMQAMVDSLNDATDQLKDELARQKSIIDGTSEELKED